MRASSDSESVKMQSQQPIASECFQGIPVACVPGPGYPVMIDLPLLHASLAEKEPDPVRLETG